VSDVQKEVQSMRVTQAVKVTPERTPVKERGGDTRRETTGINPRYDACPWYGLAHGKGGISGVY
jgi:hypothetical protein